MPEGITTALVEAGTPLGVQLPAVPQSALKEPFHDLLAPVTLKMPVPVPAPVSGLVTVTLPAPVVAEPETVTFTVSFVELVKVTVLTEMPALENVTVAPSTKLVPVMSTSALAPWASELGLAGTRGGGGPG